jgi:hypothetical protein
MTNTLRVFALVLTLAVASAITSVAFAQAPAASAPPASSSGYAAVNGLRV